MVVYKKYNLKDELAAVNEKDKKCSSRLESIEDELHDVQLNIQGLSSILRLAYSNYEKAKEDVIGAKFDWIWKNGNLTNFVHDTSKEATEIEIANRKMNSFKEIGNRLNEERKVIRKDREDIAVQVGQLMRVIKFINGYDREPRITQQVVSLDSNVGGAVMGLRVNVYYKSFWVHSKIDVYYKKQNTWYLDKIDVTKKTSAARGIALDNLMTDYITKKN